eukprot:Hpha_TRINITY_DN22808_c0_g1::TRINITY_DN22808_c0_g1_i1::g.84300::m.84300
MRGWLGGVVTLVCVLAARDVAAVHSPHLIPLPSPVVQSTEVSMQIVSHHLIMRGSPIHDQAFGLVKALNASYVRYVPWLPYPQYGVVELEPPSAHLCASKQSVRPPQTLPSVLDCGAGKGVIEEVLFASWGTSTGSCGSYTVNPKCHLSNTSSIVADACVGKPSCALDVGTFPDPCFGTPKVLHVEVRCSTAPQGHTYYNFTLPDQMMHDVYDALGGAGSTAIPNFSTPPSWLYANGSTYCDDPSLPCGNYECCGKAPARDREALGAYYGRLVSWYTKGYFVDELGERHTAPVNSPRIDIRNWEVYNEPDHEWGHTPQSYTLDYDAIVEGIRNVVPDMKFVGMNLPNIDDQTAVVKWARYFLAAENHVAAARDSLDYIGFHAYPTNGHYTQDPASFTRMFAYADEFNGTVVAVAAVIAELSPRTRIVLDETGTDMDNVLPDRTRPLSQPLYWVASGGYFAYMWSMVSQLGHTVLVLGASQLMDDQHQEPSVSLVDYATGNGTARYWVLRLLKEDLGVGDTITGTANSAGYLMQTYRREADGSTRALVINKGYAAIKVQCTGCVGRVVDKESGEGPALPVRADASGALSLSPYATAVVLLQPTY